MTHAQRIREIRARGRIRRWEYRQRNLAHGAWLRFRTALAQAERAFRISPELYAALAAGGAKIDDRGAGLEPPRHIVWISRAQAAGFAGTRERVLRLDGEMLAAEELTLVASTPTEPAAPDWWTSRRRPGAPNYDGEPSNVIEPSSATRHTRRISRQSPARERGTRSVESNAVPCMPRKPVVIY